jgi:hypothetical protein
MGLKDIWQKTSMYKNKIKRDEDNKEQDELRKEVMEEIRPEIKQIMKDKIKEEEIEKIKSGNIKKKNFLVQLGEEFKGSTIGSNEQMDRMLGKQSNIDKTSLLSGSKNTKDYGDMMGTGKLNTNRDFGSLMGSKKDFKKDNKDILGLEKKQDDIADKIGGFVKKKK